MPVHSVTCPIPLSVSDPDGWSQLPKDAVIVIKLNMWRLPLILGTGNWHSVQKRK